MARAERKAGELLQQLERSKGGDSRSFQTGMSVSEYREVLEENNIPPVTAHRWQQEASVPEELFEEHIAGATHRRALFGPFQPVATGAVKRWDANRYYAPFCT